MARRNCRTYRNAAQAQAQAEAIAAQRPALAEEEPMRRYVHPVAQPMPVYPVPDADTAATLTQVLEQLSYQNQVLTDLLGAMNSLTAALLCRRS